MSENAKENWIVPQMRLYIVYTITHRDDPKLNREIICEKCGSYQKLHMHHTKYKGATIDNIMFLCQKCHKTIHGANHYKKDKTELSTIFENGKRFCIGSNFQFEY